MIARHPSGSDPGSKRAPVDREAATVRNACPGVLVPMETGDGLIVRVRPRLGALAPDQLAALADASLAFGNGVIELTRRGNLQIRGIARQSHARLLGKLTEARLVDDDARAEARRNLILSPLAGEDATETHDMRPIAADLQERLSRADARDFPAKLGFVLDGAGSLSLGGIRAQVRLAALDTDEGRRIAVGTDLGAVSGPGAVERDRALTRWLGRVSPAHAALTAVEMAGAIADGQCKGGTLKSSALSERLRAVLAESGITFDTRVAGGPQGIHAGVGELNRDGPSPGSMANDIKLDETLRVGLRELGGGRFAAIVGNPFGLLDADRAHRLAELARRCGLAAIRCSAWRHLCLLPLGRLEALATLERAHQLGFIVDDTDPRLAVEACPGAPACGSGRAPTRVIARPWAALTTGHSAKVSVHISGCGKGCARSRRADWTIVGCEQGYRVARDATAGECAAMGRTMSRERMDAALANPTDLAARLQRWLDGHDTSVDGGSADVRSARG